MHEIERRTVVKAAAWSLPVVALAAAAPAAAASGEPGVDAFAATVSVDMSGAFAVSTLTIQSLSDRTYSGWMAVSQLNAAGAVSGLVVSSNDWRADFTTDTLSDELATFMSCYDGHRMPVGPRSVTQVQILSSYSLSSRAVGPKFRLWTHFDWTNGWPGQDDIVTWDVPSSAPFG